MAQAWQPGTLQGVLFGLRGMGWFSPFCVSTFIIAQMFESVKFGVKKCET
jgi:hypothetical protein